MKNHIIFKEENGKQVAIQNGKIVSLQDTKDEEEIVTVGGVVCIYNRKGIENDTE